MGIYLERDIDHIMAGYSYKQLFLRLPLEHAVEVANVLMRTHSDAYTATTVWNARHIDITRDVNDIMVALHKHGAVDALHSWFAVLETVDPNWCLMIDGSGWYAPEGNFYSAAASGTIVPSSPEFVMVQIEREPDKRHLGEGAYGVGKRMISVNMPNKHPMSPTVRPKPATQFDFCVGISQGEYRFQAWDAWPDDSRWTFPGLERLRTKKGPLRKRFTTDDLEDAARLFGLDPFNRRFLTGRMIKIVTGPLREVSYTMDDYYAGRRTWLGWQQEEGDI